MIPWGNDDICCLWVGIASLAVFIWAGWPKKRELI